ncbi:helix-turn-helix domain-containing protein [Streptomyces polygonati]|uniref:Helix-turn-helix domain-containing protein n=1 Tax=Streptomyces polygonati TaxID=1617087 RepID=A0ABV8HKQ2_9ACTN
MSQLDASRGESGLLGLLVMKASPAEYEELLLRTRLAGAPADVVRKTETSVEMALQIDNRLRLLDRRRVELGELVDAVEDFGEQQALGPLLRTLARRARRLTHSDAAYVTLCDEQGGAAVAASDGAISALAAEIRLPAGRGMAGDAVAHRAAVWTADYLRDTGVTRSEELDGMVVAEGISALLAVPLRTAERVLGVLFVAERAAHDFTPDEVARATALADHAATVVERTRALEETRIRLAFVAGLQDRLRAEIRTEREAADCGRQMIESALAGGDAQELVTTAAKALAGAVVLRDGDDAVVAQYGDLTDVSAEEAEEVAGAVLEARTENRGVHLPSGVSALPVRAGGEDLGALVLRGRRIRDDVDLRLLRHAASAAAIHALSARGAGRTRRVGDEALDALLSGAPCGEPPAVRQPATPLGLDLARPHVVVVVRIETGQRGRITMWAAAHAARTGGMKVVRDSHLVLLLPGDEPGPVTRTVAAELGRALGRPVKAGGAAVSGGSDGVPRAHQEAVRCLEALTALGGEGVAATARELGFVGMLLGDNRDVGGFLDATLGPVLAYDAERSTDLEGTLAAYFAVGGSPTYAAEALQVHPNTVVRRLERVSQLLGPDWQKAGASLQIQLALQLRRVRDSLEAGDPAPAAAAS